MANDISKNKQKLEVPIRNFKIGTRNAYICNQLVFNNLRAGRPRNLLVTRGLCYLGHRALYAYSWMRPCLKICSSCVSCVNALIDRERSLAFGSLNPNNRLSIFFILLCFDLKVSFVCISLASGHIPFACRYFTIF